MPDSRDEVLRILYVRSRPLVGVDPLDARLELDKLVQILDSAKLPIRLHLLPHAEARAFHLELGKGYDVVYFDGHGNEDSLLFEGPCGEPHVLPAADFVAALKGSEAKLVFLSACESKKQAKKLTKTGVPTVVGMTKAVRQPTAAAYAEAFYAALARGRTLAQAHARGKTAIRLGLGVEPNEDIIPILLPNDSDLSLAAPGQTGKLEMTGAGARTNIALSDKYLIGRGEMMVEINRALTQHRVVVLEGEGGIGKTVLAQHVAAWRAERNKCPGGAAFVTFDPPISRDQAIAVIGVAIGGPGFEKAQGDRLKLLTDHFKEKPGLVVFDNFESVRTDPEIYVLIQTLSPHARILVTTREQVGIGKTIIVKELDDAFAAELFVHLAEQAGWDGTGDEDTVKAICSELGNMPLAIELVAPRATSLPLHMVLEQVRKNLDAVAADRPDLPERQRNLTASLDLSYDPLPRTAKLLFRRLSVFPAGATGRMLPEGCGVKYWEKPTSQLVGRRLVRFEDDRYTMLPSVRRYALDKLVAAGEKDKYERKFVRLFLALAQHISVQMDTRECAEWIAVAGEERINLPAAQSWFLAHDKQNEATGMAQLLGDPFYRAGFWAAWRDLYTPLRKHAEDEGDREPLAASLYQLAIIAYQQGDYPEARKLYDQSLAIHKELGDKAGVAQTLHNLAAIAQDQGDYAQAHKLYDQSLAIKRELGDKAGIASSLHQLANAAYLQGDYAEARKLYDQSLAIRQELGDKSGIARILGDLATLAHQLGNYDEARSGYERILFIFRRIGDKRSVAKTLHGLGILTQDQGDLAEARRLYDQSLAIAQELGDKRGIAQTLHNLAAIAQAKGDHAEARKLCDQSLAIEQELGDKAGIAKTLHQLGVLAQVQGDLPEARELYDRSLAIEQELGDKAGIAASVGQLGRLAEDEKNDRTALENYLFAFATFEELQSPDKDTVGGWLAAMQKRLGKRAFKKLCDEVVAELKGPTANG